MFERDTDVNVDGSCRYRRLYMKLSLYAFMNIIWSEHSKVRLSTLHERVLAIETLQCRAERPANKAMRERKETSL